jgi:diaminopimelate epimerase
MHGAGNDYIYVDGVTDAAPADPVALAIRLSDRHKGVGSDGLVYILPSDVADVRMRMWNADGSESEMCGNAVRCVAKLAYEKGIVRRDRVTIETLAGIKTLDLTVVDGRVPFARVDMGAPIFEPDRIPVAPEQAADAASRRAGPDFLRRFVAVGDRLFEMSCVSMGNPHAVVFVDDVANYPVTVWGPLLENHPLFPRRANIEFVQVLGPDRVRARVWERGSGETLACGTGACAIAAVCATLERTGRHVTVDLPGGSLVIDWERGGPAFLSGPCEHVFDGVVALVEET